MNEPNPVELAALRCALSGLEPWRAALRDQVTALYVVDRDYSDVGGFTNFAVKGVVKAASVPGDIRSRPPACIVTHPSLPHLGDFVVWIEEGIIVGLEATAHGDGRWPVDAAVDEFTFRTESRT